MNAIVQTLAVYALPVLFAITVHEAAHGYVARLFGDQTAFVAGRITLNPLKHIDPVGTVVVPLIILLASSLAGTGGFLFGWARPVPVSFSNLNHPKRDMIWVAAAGPAANLVMAVGWAVILNVLLHLGVKETFFLKMAQAGVFVNIGLMALNLLPVPPLDGGRIVTGLLPAGLAWKYAQLERWGMAIVMLLMLTGTLGFFLEPFYRLGLAIVDLFV